MYEDTEILGDVDDYGQPKLQLDATMQTQHTDNGIRFMIVLEAASFSQLNKLGLARVGSTVPEGWGMISAAWREACRSGCRSEHRCWHHSI